MGSRLAHQPTDDDEPRREGDQNAVTRARRSVQQTSFLWTVVQAVTDETVTLAFVDQGYTGDAPREAAAPGIVLTVIKWPETKRSFVLLP